MLQKNIKRFYLITQNLKCFSQLDQDDLSHKKAHKNYIFEPDFYKNQFVQTDVKELEYVENPLYDLARAYHMDQDEAEQIIEDFNYKTQIILGERKYFTMTPPDKEELSFTRYKDKVEDKKLRRLFQFPRGEPYKWLPGDELYKIQKHQDHDKELIRSKQFISHLFFPPFELKDDVLKQVFQKYSDNYNEEFCQEISEIIPKLSVNELVNFSLYLAFQVKVNERKIWKTLETYLYQELHHFNITQICQLEWASMELKPKHIESRFNTLLVKQILEKIEYITNIEELMAIMQGFRKRKSKDIYNKLRTTLIVQKEKLFPSLLNQEQTEEVMIERSEKLANLFYCLGSNKPTKFGMFQQYHIDGINELLSVYEDDIKEGIKYMDSEHLTRIAQALYLLKTQEFEILWDQIERRFNLLNNNQNVESYHAINILRSFSHCQDNIMWGQDKTYYNMEPIILRDFDQINDRDMSHLMYSYSVRKVGNPELYEKFDKRLREKVNKFDYPSLFNALYYMMFRESQDEQIWEGIIQATIQNPNYIPIIYYRPFKASELYLEHKYPDRDLQDYYDKFWYAERYFDAQGLENHFKQEESYQKFFTFLNTQVLVFPSVFYVYNNLFLLHYVFYKQKIAINLHLKKHCLRDKAEPSEMQRLSQKLMKYQGWEILDLTEREVSNWTYGDKITNIKGWLQKAKERQIEKGIMPAVEKKYP